LTRAQPGFQQVLDDQQPIDAVARVNSPAADLILGWGKAKALAPLSQLFNAKAGFTLDF
jgi:hypothetical protein